VCSAEMNASHYSNTSTFAASSFVASLFRRFSIMTTFPNFVACFAVSSHFVTTARHLVSFVVQSLSRSRSVCNVFLKLSALNVLYLYFILFILFILFIIMFISVYLGVARIRKCYIVIYIVI
jgi:hypothetical protein